MKFKRIVELSEWVVQVCHLQAILPLIAFPVIEICRPSTREISQGFCQSINISMCISIRLRSRRICSSSEQGESDVVTRGEELDACALEP